MNKILLVNYDQLKHTHEHCVFYRHDNDQSTIFLENYAWSPGGIDVE